MYYTSDKNTKFVFSKVVQDTWESGFLMIAKVPVFMLYLSNKIILQNHRMVDMTYTHVSMVLESCLNTMFYSYKYQAQRPVRI